jgi:ribosomal protein S18 acetylase RimI-like enzyme
VTGDCHAGILWEPGGESPPGHPTCKPTIASWPGGTVDEGEQVFALCEIMVRQAWTGRGIAHRLHDEILAGRPEQFAELYVRPGNTAAYRAYVKWGWVRAGQTRPNLPDAPVFDVLMLRLPISR